MEIDRKKIILNFAIELVVYGILVTIYFLVVLDRLGDWLLNLYETNLTLYAFVALALIVVQAVVLEWVTTFLIERLGLDRLE